MLSFTSSEKNYKYESVKRSSITDLLDNVLGFYKLRKIKQIAVKYIRTIILSKIYCSVNNRMQNSRHKFTNPINYNIKSKFIILCKKPFMQVNKI